MSNVKYFILQTLQQMVIARWSLELRSSQSVQQTQTLKEKSPTATWSK